MGSGSRNGGQKKLHLQLVLAFFDQVFIDGHVDIQVVVDDAVSQANGSGPVAHGLVVNDVFSVQLGKGIVGGNWDSLKTLFDEHLGFADGVHCQHPQGVQHDRLFQRRKALSMVQALADFIEHGLQVTGQ